MIKEYHQWFNEARYGMFIHWGPYAAIGRGEQVLFRENLDQREYEEKACAWNPSAFDPCQWADLAVKSGMKYAVLTTRHHDGYCLWDSKLTDYTSVVQAAKRDFVREYVEAFRDRSLRVGLYYSLADWRIPAYWERVEKDPAAWERFRGYVHNQVKELLTQYGKIDVIWFDGAWPKTAEEWKSHELVDKIREWQPEILVNNRLSAQNFTVPGAVEAAGASDELGDFGTPEHHITPDPKRIWESCQVSSWRLWGYARGEQYRSPEAMLDFLSQCASLGGNLLLNVAPDGEGFVPKPVAANLLRVGDWLEINGECIYGTEPGDLAEFTTQGYQTRRGDSVYLVYRFWPHAAQSCVPGIKGKVTRATLLGSAETLSVDYLHNGLVIRGLPEANPGDLFPVIRLEFENSPEVMDWAKDRLWQGDSARMAPWARKRGETEWLK